MRILITGSAGFIGGSVGRYAAARGHTVIGVARRSQADRDWPGEHVAVDVADSDMSSVIAEAQPDVVFHAAGSASVGGSVASPINDFRAAVVSWINVLDGIRRSGQRPLVVFPSSAAVYGNPSSLPVTEQFEINPISPYGYHKAACELIAREYASCFGFNILLMRVFSVFGPSQRRLLIWDIFRQAVSAAPEIWLEGTGRESRDYLHVDDLAALMLQLSAASQSRGAGLTVANAGRGEETAILTVADMVQKAAGTAKAIRCRGHERPGDPRRWLADTSRVHTLAPTFKAGDLSSGLGEVVRKWMV